MFAVCYMLRKIKWLKQRKRKYSSINSVVLYSSWNTMQILRTGHKTYFCINQLITAEEIPNKSLKLTSETQKLCRRVHILSTSFYSIPPQERPFVFVSSNKCSTLRHLIRLQLFALPSSRLNKFSYNFEVILLYLSISKAKFI